MTDFLLTNKICERFQNQPNELGVVEADLIFPPQEEEEMRKRAEKVQKILVVIAILFAVISAYLSWTRNTKLGESTGMKILYGFFAAMLGSTYILFYGIRYMMERDLAKGVRA